jgi:hypothetical protein
MNGKILLFLALLVGVILTLVSLRLDPFGMMSGMGGAISTDSEGDDLRGQLQAIGEELRQAVAQGAPPAELDRLARRQAYLQERYRQYLKERETPSGLAP